MLMEYENNLVIKEKPLMAYDGLINGICYHLPYNDNIIIVKINQHIYKKVLT